MSWCPPPPSEMHERGASRPPPGLQPRRSMSATPKAAPGVGGDEGRLGLRRWPSPASGSPGPRAPELKDVGLPHGIPGIIGAYYSGQVLVACYDVPAREPALMFSGGDTFYSGLAYMAEERPAPLILPDLHRLPAASGGWRRILCSTSLWVFFHRRCSRGVNR